MAQGIPATYVPARNTVFLSIALAWAETLGAFDIFIGVNCIDYSGYPDCRPEYLRSFEALANLATRAGVEGAGRFQVHAPLLTLTKEQIIERGLALGVDFALTHSCYDPTSEGLSCARCDACRIRRSAFERLGRTDPVRYVSWI
jgi:7-cyano-7-deazaguanine synthase